LSVSGDELLERKSHGPLLWRSRLFQVTGSSKY